MKLLYHYKPIHTHFQDFSSRRSAFFFCIPPGAE